MVGAKPCLAFPVAPKLTKVKVILKVYLMRLKYNVDIDPTKRNCNASCQAYSTTTEENTSAIEANWEGGGELVCIPSRVRLWS